MNSASTWPLRTVARAADMNPRALRQLFETGVLKFRGDDRHSTGSGVKVGLSKHRAYEAAIVQALRLSGVMVSRAARAAYEFTLSGNNGRAAGHLFPTRKSVLVLGPNDSVVANVDFDARVSDLTNNGVSIVVDLNKVVADVDAVLNS
jgi:hypothetical protein